MSRALLSALLFSVIALVTPPLAAGEIQGAVMVLETAAGTPSDRFAAPPRFVLMKDGQVFVGGSSLLETGRLEKNEAQALQKRASALRKLPGISSPISFGGTPDRVVRLHLLEDDPLEIVVTGDDPAPAPLTPLAAFIQDLASFHQPGLRPYAPSSYAMAVREARLAGGCRSWSFAFPLAQALAGARAVPAADAVGWPTGAMPASVCVDDKRYVVTLRPLLPDERP